MAVAVVVAVAVAVGIAVAVAVAAAVSISSSSIDARGSLHCFVSFVCVMNIGSYRLKRFLHPAVAVCLVEA